MDSAGPPKIQAEVAICNQRGLHARASAKFVRTAESFDADVTVSKDGFEVTGTSIMGLMLLAAAIGDRIRITARGIDAEAAIAALVALVEAKFEESE